MKYKVLREHEADRLYLVGEERVANPNQVAHLVGKVLKPFEEEDDLADQPSEANVAPGATDKAANGKSSAKSKAATKGGDDLADKASGVDVAPDTTDQATTGKSSAKSKAATKEADAKGAEA